MEYLNDPDPDYQTPESLEELRRWTAYLGKLEVQAFPEADALLARGAENLELGLGHQIGDTDPKSAAGVREWVVNNPDVATKWIIGVSRAARATIRDFLYAKWQEQHEE